MKLYSLNPMDKLTINIDKISRRLRFNILIDYLPEMERKLRGLILITDGTPDDYVIAILSYHLDGEEVFAIAKPERPRLGALPLISNYLSRLRGLSKIAILMDQENDTLNYISGKVIEILSGCKESFVRNRLHLINAPMEEEYLKLF